VSVFEAGTRVHIIGVGGAGMSGLARLLFERGCLVSGSDAHDSPVLSELAALGVGVRVGHASVGDVDVVTWSPAIAPGNVELVDARERGLRLVSRAEALADLVAQQPTIGLTGTHGKTTATSMMAHVLAAAGRDVSRLVGAAVTGLGANGHWGPDGLVLEVDESYGTFEQLRPVGLGLLNVEADHLDHYASAANLEAAFARLLERTSGPVVAWDDKGARRVGALVDRDVTWVGTGSVPWRVDEITLERRSSSFTLRGAETMSIHLAVSGAHNVADAAVVAVLARESGVATSAIIEGLARFVGAPRRFEYHGRWREADVYEDYAHLPGEVRAALAGARAGGYHNLTVVFQPHRYSRTRHLARDFADAFVDAARVIVTDVYGAGEVDPGDVSGRLVLEAITDAHPEATCAYVDELSEVTTVLEGLTDVGDAIVFVGAGDVGTLAAALVGES
jgi:UDP-N-acetylmuramate--alanine ligase